MVQIHGVKCKGFILCEGVGGFALQRGRSTSFILRNTKEKINFQAKESTYKFEKGPVLSNIIVSTTE